MADEVALFDQLLDQAAQNPRGIPGLLRNSFINPAEFSAEYVAKLRNCNEVRSKLDFGKLQNAINTLAAVPLVEQPRPQGRVKRPPAGRGNARQSRMVDEEEEEEEDDEEGAAVAAAVAGRRELRRRDPRAAQAEQAEQAEQAQAAFGVGGGGGSSTQVIADLSRRVAEANQQLAAQDVLLQQGARRLEGPQLTAAVMAKVVLQTRKYALELIDMIRLQSERVESGEDCKEAMQRLRRFSDLLSAGLGDHVNNESDNDFVAETMGKLVSFLGIIPSSEYRFKLARLLFNGVKTPRGRTPSAVGVGARAGARADDDDDGDDGAAGADHAVGGHPVQDDTDPYGLFEQQQGDHAMIIGAGEGDDEGVERDAMGDEDGEEGGDGMERDAMGGRWRAPDTSQLLWAWPFAPAGGGRRAATHRGRQLRWRNWAPAPRYYHDGYDYV